MTDKADPQQTQGTVRGLLRLFRFKDWLKNTFVFAPLFFAGLFFKQEALLNALLAFALFSLGAAAVYIVNDIKDRESDRKHPVKALSRPLASGEVSLRAALILLFSIYAVLALCWFIAAEAVQVIVFYILLNLAYSFYLKHIAVVDIFCIASGFVLRVYAGAVAIAVPLSAWMFVTTLCLALYLAAIKRRQELKSSSGETRQVLEKYSEVLLERYALMSATSALLFYSMYVFSEHEGMVLSIPLVLFGLYRYWYVVEQQNKGESPADVILKDLPMILCGVLWLIVCLLILMVEQGF